MSLSHFSNVFDTIGSHSGELVLSEGAIDQLVGAIAEEADRAENASQAGVVIAQKLNAAAAKLSPECAARLGAKTAVMMTGKYYVAAREMQVAADDWGGNQYVPLDTGDTFIAGFADTGVFTVTVNTTFRWVDFVVSREMTTKFGLKAYAVAGFSSMQQGFTVNVTPAPVNGSLTLAGMDPDYDRAAANPFLGREYNPNTPIQVQGHEITGNANRFMAAIVIRLQGVCVPASRPVIRTAYVSQRL